MTDSDYTFKEVKKLGGQALTKNVKFLQECFDREKVGIMVGGSIKLYLAIDYGDLELTEGAGDAVLGIELFRHATNQYWYRVIKGRLNQYIPNGHKFKGVGTKDPGQGDQEVKPWDRAKSKATSLSIDAPKNVSLWACVEPMPDGGLYVITAKGTWYHARPQGWDALDDPIGAANVYLLYLGTNGRYQLGDTALALGELTAQLKERKEVETQTSTFFDLSVSTQMRRDSTGAVLYKTLPVTFLGEAVYVDREGWVTAGGDQLYYGRKDYDQPCKIDDVNDDLEFQGTLKVKWGKHPLHKRNGDHFHSGVAIEDHDFYADVLVDRLKGYQGVEFETNKLVIPLNYQTRAHYSLFTGALGTVQAAIVNALRGGNQSPGARLAQVLSGANGAHATLEPAGYSNTNINVYPDGNVVYQNANSGPGLYNQVGRPTFAQLISATIRESVLNNMMGW